MKKKKMVERIREMVKDAKGIYFANFTGMPVSELQEVRRKMKAAKIEISVVKNRLALIAFKEVGLLDKARRFLRGPTSLIVSREDEILPARLLRDFQKNYKIKFKGALIEDAIFDAEQFSLLASIPPREDLISQLLGSLLSPLTGLTNQLTELLNSLVLVLEEIARKTLDNS